MVISNDLLSGTRESVCFSVVIEFENSLLMLFLKYYTFETFEVIDLPKLMFYIQSTSLDPI